MTPLRQPKEDLSGKNYGHLTVMNFIEYDESNQAQYLVRCDCGKIKRIERGNLKRTKSCGTCDLHTRLLRNGQKARGAGGVKVVESLVKDLKKVLKRAEKFLEENKA